MMMFCSLSRSAVVLAGLCVLSLSAGVGNAGIISPEYSTFGSLPAASFGGSGIDNNSVAIRTIKMGTKTITLGLTATSRYGSPAVGNNGAGVFTAQVGEDSSAAGYAGWNFNYYINVAGGNNSDYRYKLFYDADPGVGTDSTALGVLNIPSLSELNYQNSMNLGFGYLKTGTTTVLFLGTIAAPGVTKPAFSFFDPTVSGQYSFSLVAYAKAGLMGYGDPLGRSSITVNVSAVPEPATMVMFSLLTVGAAGAYRRKQRVAAC